MVFGVDDLSDLGDGAGAWHEPVDPPAGAGEGRMGRWWVLRPAAQRHIDQPLRLRVQGRALNSSAGLGPEADSDTGRRPACASRVPAEQRVRHHLRSEQTTDGAGGAVISGKLLTEGMAVLKVL